MGRKILLITTDQQRFDALGCNGGRVARTPTLDGLAAQGVRYERCHPQSVVCMPSRATIVTGQHVGTHGVWMNGVPLPADAPSVAAVLHDAGYRTALFGKSHFEPYLDPFLRFPENQMGKHGVTGPHRGFEHMELATHGALGLTHYAQWMQAQHPEHVFDYFPVIDMTLEVSANTGGDTDAVQVGRNAIPRELYHTDWVVERALAWLDTVDDDEDWFCWVSFPDPHHPWDPPESEMGRVDWHDLDLPAGYVVDADERERILADKPHHWLQWYRGELVTNYEAPPAWVPATLTPDQLREIDARIHVENELIDEAVGRLLRRLTERGWEPDTDVVYTTDHGELQGDYGLLFKGPYHVDSLMRLPLIWRPAPSSGATPAVVDQPVGLVDVAPTLCRIAGVDVPEWMEGVGLPGGPADPAGETAGPERVLTQWDSAHPDGHWVHLRTICRDGWVATACLPSTVHDGTEGELYSLEDDPLQHHNRWDDPSVRALRDDLLDDLRRTLPTLADPLPRVEAPV